MSSADMNHPSNSGVWPEDPYGDMAPILEASVEAAKERHPSGKEIGTGAHEAIEEEIHGAPDVLSQADRCDNDCTAEALYRLQLRDMTLEFCHHHHAKHFPAMSPWGWKVVGRNASLHAELYRTDRSQGGTRA
jgi:hypothetical protein